MSSPAIPRKITVTFSPEAKRFMNTATPAVREALIELIKERAPYAHEQMIMLSWTCDGSWPHIERVFKSYRFSPGIRMLFHFAINPDGICIDRIDWRDCEPYRSHQE
jgi:hypothetical protein